jgi:hypothetical protein
MKRLLILIMLLATPVEARGIIRLGIAVRRTARVDGQRASSRKHPHALAYRSGRRTYQLTDVSESAARTSRKQQAHGSRLAM